MSGLLLALNVGSASLKAAAYRLAQDRPIEVGRIAIEEVHGIGAYDPVIALEHALTSLPALGEPEVIVHRIVHGGENAAPIELTSTAYDELDSLATLAPLHQTPALALARAAQDRWPRARHYATFDTSWHLTMAERYRRFPLPRELYAKGVRRYGFHGLAFESAMQQLKSLAPECAPERIVLAHLGGGSSLCAALGGHCVTTSMGMTPLGGIPMSTRPGSLDPGVVLHLQRGLAMSPDAIDQLLWRESGLRGISSLSGDIRELLSSPSSHAREAIAAYVAGVAQGIAAMVASIGGIDALVFSGGVGKHAATVRADIAALLGWMRLELDADLNGRSADEISAHGSAVRTFTFAVDEELMMAMAVAKCLQAPV